MKRISTILDIANSGGNVSAAQKLLWTLAVLAATMLVTVTLAFCQEKTGTDSAQKQLGKRIADIEKTDWFKLLNDKQKQYVQWDERQFAYAYEPKNYEVGDDDRAAIEKRWVRQLEGTEPGFPGRGTLSTYDEAILGLATIKSERAAELLLKIAAEKVVKDNAHRHYATKALGMLGDVSVAPELIPLIYHYNFNTRWDAQVALVRLTGQNFGADAEAWGKWYGENREKLAKKSGKELPVFDTTPVDWTCGDTDKELQKWSKPEEQKKSDEQFFANQSGASNPDAPKIVKMFPENGAKNVDPNISQVYLTFDIPMGGGRAWAQRDNNTALDIDEGNPVFWTADKLTCVAPVVLKPNKKYEILLNFKPFIGFASLAGVPSEGVFYTFETGAGPIDSKKREELAKNLFEKPK
jgi:hypothetical protein